jgi:hypothetical protein
MYKYGLLTKDGEKITYVIAESLEDAVTKFTIMKQIPEKSILEIFYIEKLDFYKY